MKTHITQLTKYLQDMHSKRQDKGIGTSQSLSKYKSVSSKLIGAVDPRNVLEEAHEKNKEKIGLQGSSTACILSFNKESGVLHVVNVGDSGLMLFRDNKLLYQSPIQQRMFNFTYRLGNGINSDSPDSAWEKKDIQTVQGDII
ncbi:hypothetical protein TB2_022563 [Malus domestica]